ALLELLARNISLEREEVRTQLTSFGLDKMVALADRTATHRSDKFAEPEAEASMVEAGWRHASALHQAQVGLKEALPLAERGWQAEPTEAPWRRIVEIQQRLPPQPTP